MHALFGRGPLKRQWNLKRSALGAFYAAAFIAAQLLKNRPIEIASHGPQMKRAPPIGGAPLGQWPSSSCYVFIDSKNSELFLVLRSLSSRKSIASIVPIGLRIRRSTYIFLSSCGSVISSSLRVPEREM